jgi:TRAP-type uncharacterized transport system fused permease subunit
MATAWQAMRLGIVLYIVPFMFVYSPELLVIGSWPAIALAVARAALGVLCLAGGLQGWLRGRATVTDRALLIAAAVLFIVPSFVADAAAIVLLATVYGLQWTRRDTIITPAPAASLD